MKAGKYTINLGRATKESLTVADNEKPRKLCLRRGKWRLVTRFLSKLGRSRAPRVWVALVGQGQASIDLKMNNMGYLEATTAGKGTLSTKATR
jgi:hypothetical protein